MRRMLGADSNCMDVGANEGLMLRYAPRGIHHAFEPLPHLAQALRVNDPAA